MSTYDDVKLPNGQIEQIKAWSCEMKTYQIGDRVPTIGNLKTYGIVTRDTPGILFIEDRVIKEWMDFPEYPDQCLTHISGPLFDKWGGTWHSSKENSGIMGEPYFWKEKE